MEFVAKLASIDYDMAEIVKRKRKLLIPSEVWVKDKMWNELVFKKLVLEKKKKTVLDSIVTGKLLEYKEYNKNRSSAQMTKRRVINLPDPVEMIIYPKEEKWDCDINEHDMLRALRDAEIAENLLRNENK